MNSTRSISQELRSYSSPLSSGTEQLFSLLYDFCLFYTQNPLTVGSSLAFFSIILRWVRQGLPLNRSIALSKNTERKCFCPGWRTPMYPFSAPERYRPLTPASHRIYDFADWADCLFNGCVGRFFGVAISLMDLFWGFLALIYGGFSLAAHRQVAALLDIHVILLLFVAGRLVWVSLH